MAHVVEAVYVKGVLKPLGKLDLREGQRVRVVVEPGESVVEETFGLLRGKRDLVEKLLRELEDEIALH